MRRGISQFHPTLTQPSQLDSNSHSGFRPDGGPCQEAQPTWSPTPKRRIPPFQNRIPHAVFNQRQGLAGGVLRTTCPLRRPLSRGFASLLPPLSTFRIGFTQPQSATTQPSLAWGPPAIITTPAYYVTRYAGGSSWHSRVSRGNLGSASLSSCNPRAKQSGYYMSNPALRETLSGQHQWRQAPCTIWIGSQKRRL